MRAERRNGKRAWGTSKRLSLSLERERERDTHRDRETSKRCMRCDILARYSLKSLIVTEGIPCSGWTWKSRAERERGREGERAEREREREGERERVREGERKQEKVRERMIVRTSVWERKREDEEDLWLDPS
jgi:hypothetical protein